MTARPAGAEKARLRRAVLGRRALLAPADLAAAGDRLAAAVAPLAPAGAPVAAYAALGSEPPTARLLARLAGVRVLLPVLTDDGDLDWAEWSGRLEPGLRGTSVPVGDRLGRDAVADCALVVVPAVAVDVRGVRLGRGGGAYDRTLRRARGLVVALLHDGELLDAVPEEPHDVRVAAAATPSSGLVRLPTTLPA